MARIPSRTNYTKLVYNAKATKGKVKKNKLEAYAKWQSKRGKKASKLDKIDDGLRTCLKELEAAQKAKEEEMKAVSRLVKMITEAHKELQAYQQVPVSGKLPPMPKNVVGLQSMIIVVTGMLVYLAGVKVYMAMAAALSEKDK